MSHDNSPYPGPKIDGHNISDNDMAWISTQLGGTPGPTQLFKPQCDAAQIQRVFVAGGVLTPNDPSPAVAAAVAAYKQWKAGSKPHHPHAA